MGASSSKPWRKLVKDTFEECEEYYKKKIKELSVLKNEYNVVIIGPTGAGKSSYINSMFTILDEDYANVAQIRANGIKCTLKCTAYSTEKTEGLMCNVKIIDTMGIQTDGKGIQEDNLIAVLDGKIKIGNVDEEEEVTEGNNKYRPHAVIIVVSALNIDSLSPDSVWLTEYEQIFNRIPNDVKPLVVITHCDQLGDVNGDLKKIYFSSKLVSVIETIKEKIGVTQENIFPVANYVGESARHITTMQNITVHIMPPREKEGVIEAKASETIGRRAARDSIRKMAKPLSLAMS
ncbi:interferon-induced protein 44-like [Mya arenaria]|uniref:interferon-induced protein 44-like n=1 Tax=Mya arenaria TaxID=6604 RepID=UPI0022E2213C|nr:interferon-induced protein 44-like [Mya arenaria]